MSDLLIVEGIHKSAKHHFWERHHTLLDGVSFSVARGEVLGLVGHNGAGKTTLFKIILGLSFADKGSVTFTTSGKGDPREKIGYLSESPYFYKYLSALEALSFYDALHQQKAVSLSKSDLQKVMLEVGLPGQSHGKKLGKFSKGMLQRFGMAQALVSDPDLLILDEPMSGLDPAGRKNFHELILDQKKRGKTILFSTHILDDVQRLCDRVLLLNNGKLLGSIRTDDIGAKATWSVHHEDTSGESSITAPTGSEGLNSLLKDIFGRGGKISHIEKVADPLGEWIEAKKQEGE